MNQVLNSTRNEF